MENHHAHTQKTHLRSSRHQRASAVRDQTSAHTLVRRRAKEPDLQTSDQALPQVRPEIDVGQPNGDGDIERLLTIGNRLKIEAVERSAISRRERSEAGRDVHKPVDNFLDL